MAGRPGNRRLAERRKMQSAPIGNIRGKSIYGRSSQGQFSSNTRKQQQRSGSADRRINGLERRKKQTGTVIKPTPEMAEVLELSRRPSPIIIAYDKVQFDALHAPKPDNISTQLNPRPNFYLGVQRRKSKGRRSTDK